MADQTATMDKILDRIDELATRNEAAAPNAHALAKAVNELAEAWAWIASPGQPHGGST